MRNFCNVRRQENLEFELFFSVAFVLANLGWGMRGWKQPIEMAYTHPRLNTIRAGFEA